MTIEIYSNMYDYASSKDLTLFSSIKLKLKPQRHQMYRIKIVTSLIYYVGL